MVSSDGDEECITVLRPFDVLFGRGSGPNTHVGNISFRSMVSERKDEYLATTNRRTKVQIAEDIVSAVLSKNGRFLKKAKASSAALKGVPKSVEAWTEVDQVQRMEKAKQALRQHREKVVESISDDGRIDKSGSMVTPIQTPSQVEQISMAHTYAIGSNCNIDDRASQPVNIRPIVLDKHEYLPSVVSSDGIAVQQVLQHPKIADLLQSLPVEESMSQYNIPNVKDEVKEPTELIRRNSLLMEDLQVMAHDMRRMSMQSVVFAGSEMHDSSTTMGTIDQIPGRSSSTFGTTYNDSSLSQSSEFSDSQRLGIFEDMYKKNHAEKPFMGGDTGGKRQDPSLRLSSVFLKSDSKLSSALQSQNMSEVKSNSLLVEGEHAKILRGERSGEAITEDSDLMLSNHSFSVMKESMLDSADFNCSNVSTFDCSNVSTFDSEKLDNIFQHSQKKSV